MLLSGSSSRFQTYADKAGVNRRDCSHTRSSLRIIAFTIPLLKPTAKCTPTTNRGECTKSGLHFKRRLPTAPSASLQAFELVNRDFFREFFLGSR